MIYFNTLKNSFRYALEGLWYALKHNQNLRVHFVVAVIVMIFSLLFKLSGFEMGIVGIIILLVIVTEMINSAIEQMVNLITTEHRKEAKIAKDVGAAMVLVTATGSILVGILIFIPHVIKMFR